MKLSIIIPVYNVEKHISRCLDSLINQDIDKSEYEVIIISDGSKDNSIPIAERYCKLHVNFSIYHQENQGVGAARNKGLSLAKGDYIYFLDPDDYIADYVFKTLIETAIESKPEILTFNSLGTSSLALNKSSTNDFKLLNIRSLKGMNYIAQHNFSNEIWWYIIDRQFLNKDDKVGKVLPLPNCFQLFQQVLLLYQCSNGLPIGFETRLTILLQHRLQPRQHLIHLVLKYLRKLRLNYQQNQ